MYLKTAKKVTSIFRYREFEIECTIKTNLPGQSEMSLKHFFLQHDLQSSKLHLKPCKTKR